MRIDSITLKNFQIHKNTTLEFSPGVNVILGETDQGKSSIAKALYWFFFNRPSGDEFISTGKKECRVQITSGANIASRVKNTSGLNQYILNDTEFNALRTDVPDEIKQALKITDTNIQLQFDPPFLLDLNAGDVAKKLNTVIGISEIDSSLKYINSVVRACSTEETHTKKEIKSREKKIKRYDGLGEIQELYAEYDDAGNKLGECREEIDVLEDALYALEQKQFLSGISEQVTKAKEAVIKIQELDGTCTQCIDDFDVLEDIIDSLEYLSEYIFRGEKLLKKANISVTALQETFESYDKASKQYKDIDKRYQWLYDTTMGILSAEKEHKASVIEFEKWTKELGICPLCESDLT